MGVSEAVGAGVCVDVGVSVRGGCVCVCVGGEEIHLHCNHG